MAANSPADWPVASYIRIQREPDGRQVRVTAPGIDEVVDRGNLGRLIVRAEAAYNHKKMSEVFT